MTGRPPLPPYTQDNVFTRSYASREHLERIKDMVIAVDDETDTSRQEEQGKDNVESRGRRGAEVEVISRKRKRSPSLSPPPAPPLPLGSRSSFPCPPRRLSIRGRPVKTKKPCIWYRGEIKKLPREKAREYALEIDQAPLRTPEVHRYVFWTDCSVVFRCGAGSVVWRDPENLAWQSEEYPYPRSTNDTDFVELFAIAHALAIAVRQVTEDKQAAFDAFCKGSSDCAVQPRYHVLVFSDSVGALNRLEKQTSRNKKQCDETWQLVLKCIEHHAELERLQASVVIQLVPGHNQVPGNVEADRRAYAFARRMGGKEIPSAAPQVTQSTALEGTSSSTLRNFQDTNTGIAQEREKHPTLKTVTQKARKKTPRSTTSKGEVSLEVAESTQAAILPKGPSHVGTSSAAHPRKPQDANTETARTWQPEERVTWSPTGLSLALTNLVTATASTVQEVLSTGSLHGTATPMPVAQSLLDGLANLRRMVQSIDPVQSSKQTSKSAPATSKKQVIQANSATISPKTLAPSSAATMTTAQPPPPALTAATPSPVQPSPAAVIAIAPGSAASSTSTLDQAPLRPQPIHKLPARPRLPVYPSTAPPPVPDFGFQYPNQQG